MALHTIDLSNQSRSEVCGPLTVDGKAPHYFLRRDGKPIFLTGSHNWSVFQECFSGDPDVEFDFPAFLSWLEAHNHNFIRGWHWEQTSWDQMGTERVPIRPLPFTRIGSGAAKDGLPKFDCTQFNEEYFSRLRERLLFAQDRGFYVSVMLFEGWSTDVRFPERPVANPWDGHPFNGSNNVNDLDGDPGQTGSGRAVHTLAIPEITKIQEAYVQKVIKTLNDLDNVLYEIGNEHYEDSYPWQEHMVQFIHRTESDMQNQHPVGITSGGGGDDAVTNSQLEGSSADWIAPRERNEKNAPYMDDPPVPSLGKGVFADTDHLWGLGGYPGWVWKSFTRGLNVLLMDCYEPMHGMDEEHWTNWGGKNRRDHPLYEPIRNAMGYARYLAEKIDLSRCIPRSELASSRFCLADEGNQYVVYSDENASVTVSLLNEGTKYFVEWIDPKTGRSDTQDIRVSQGQMEFDSPFGDQSVLYLSRV